MVARLRALHHQVLYRDYGDIKGITNTDGINRLTDPPPAPPQVKAKMDFRSARAKTQDPQIVNSVRSRLNKPPVPKAVNVGGRGLKLANPSSAGSSARRGRSAPDGWRLPAVITQTFFYFSLSIVLQISSNLN